MRTRRPYPRTIVFRNDLTRKDNDKGQDFLDIPAITPSQNFVFGRVGVKLSGVEDIIFPPIQQIEF